jgi:hypothetical protein
MSLMMFIFSFPSSYYVVGQPISLAAVAAAATVVNSSSSPEYPVVSPAIKSTTGI